MRKTELNLLNTMRQMAEAWRIHNKYHSNPAEKDSDGELSVLASSLFNGMEGIEMGGSGSEIQGI